MAILFPPYSKKHIILFGSLALFASFTLLFMLKNASFSTHQSDKSNVTSVTAETLQNNRALKDPLHDVQHGMTDVTWATKNFVLLDVRTESEFNQLHLSGAVNAPLEFLPASSLTPEINMVVYSDDEAELSKAASILQDKGISDIYLLHEPLEQLKSQGYILVESEGQ